jgi:GNAT superfamily N-acetyltransferase
MRIERLEPGTDAGRARECYEVGRAALAVDNPEAPVMSGRVFRGWLKFGWMADPRETWVAVEGGGAVAGWYLLELPSRDNAHRGQLELVVRPDRRRRGVGLALLRHAAQRAAADGRTLLAGRAWDGSAGEAFARWLGATAGVADIGRALDIGSVPAARLAELRAGAERAASGYTLVSWAGRTPEEYLEQVAAVNRAMYDAPHDESFAEPVWDVARVRDTERRLPLLGVRAYAVAARHDGSGELGGLTQVEVDPEQPERAYQGLTAVVRAHRGHRLGLLLKVAMLELLATAEPAVARIFTDNAESNEHMIAINRTLGYRPVGKPVRSFELATADVLAGVQS